MTPLYLRYVSNSSSGYGYDLARWTARFEKAVAFELAVRIAPKASGSSDSLIERLQADALKAKSDALAYEALRNPPRRLPEGRWNRTRWGNNWHVGSNYRYG